MSEIQISQLVQSMGTIGVLVVILLQFLKGNLVTKSTVDRLLEESENRSQLIANALEKSIKQAVKEGMLEAQFEWSKSMLSTLPCVKEQSKRTASRVHEAD